MSGIAQSALAKTAVVCTLLLVFAGSSLAQTWTQIATAAAPPPGITHAAHYDAASNRLILFVRPEGGGANEVWVLLDANNLGPSPNWVKLVPATPFGAPPVRHAQADAYDAANNRLIIFGGCNGGCFPVLNDVWVLTNANGLGGTPTWIPLAPSGTPPSGRAHPRAGYDPTTNRMMIFGGQNGGGFAGATFPEVWILTNANGSGGTPSWQQLATAGPFPPGQYTATVNYDPGTNRLIAFGGAAQGTGASTNATYVLSNANGLGGTPTWMNLVPEGAVGSPPVRSSHTASYDEAENKLIVIGGCPLGVCPNDETWILSNANGSGGAPVWTSVAPGSGPTVVGAGDLDAANDRLITWFAYHCTTSGCVPSPETFVLSNALGGATPPLSAGISVVPASTITGAPLCKPGFPPPQCYAAPFDTATDLAYQGNGFAQPAVARDNIGAPFDTIHRPDYANDGYYGNGASWISNSSNSWLKVDLGRTARIDRITFGRDRTGNYDDRDPGQFRIYVALSDDVYADGDDSNDAAEYTLIFDSSTFGFSGVINGPQTIQARFAPVNARFVKIEVDNFGTAIDELEVFGSVDCVSPAGLVSCWPAEGSAADAVDGNHGTLIGGAAFAPGRVGQAFALDGIDDFVDLGNAPSLHLSSGEFTVAAWVKFNSQQGDMSILDKMGGDVNADGWRLIKQDDNRFWFCFGGGFNRCFDPAFTVFSQTHATTGTWFHVAVVKSASSFAIYVNGVLEDSRSPVPAFVDTNSANLRIGSYALLGAHLDGLVDEVRVFNRALTAQEIQALSNPDGVTPATPRIPAPAGALAGLAYDGASLYVTYASSPCEIDMLNPTTGAVLAVLPSPLCQPRGMVYDGEHLFVTSLGNFGAGDVFEMDTSGNVLNSFTVPFRAHAIAFDGRHLYVGDTDSGQIRVTDRQGNHIRTFDSGLRPAGMVYDPSSGHLWVITISDNKIYEITTDGQMIRSCDTPRNPGVQGLGGLTMVGSKLYVGEADPDPFNPPAADPPAVIYILEPAALPCSPEFTPPACMPPPANAVSWWPAEGNATDFADGNTGTLMNGVTFAAGRVGEAFSLSGAGAYVDFGNAANLHVSAGDFTVAAWVYFNALGGDMSIVDKMASGPAPNTNGWRLLKQSDNRFWFCLGGGSANHCGDPAYTLFSATPAITGAWFYVVAVKNSREFSLYVNGMLEDRRSPLPAFLDTNTANLRVGSYVMEGAFLNGLVDEVQVFNRALTPQEISATFSAGGAGQCRPATPPNQPPVADAGSDQIVEATGPLTAAMLDGSASSDPDAGQMLSYQWRDAGNNIVGTAATVGVSLPLGTHTFTLTVDDGSGATASDSVTIVVQDTTAPALMLVASSYQQILPIGTTSLALDVLALSGATVTDAVDAAPAITTNAPAQFAAGVTNVTITATDQSGNSSQATFTVTLITPAQAIQQLSGIVQSFNLQQGLSNSLDSKLQNAQEALDAANANNRNDAVNKMQAFINSVEAQRGNQITDAQADQLIAAALAVLAAI